MVKKSQITTIAQCQTVLRSLIDSEYFAYDVKTISFYFGTTKITLLNADYKPLVDKGPKLADLQLACLNFSATYNFEVACKVNNEGLIESTLAAYQWDETIQKMVLLPLNEDFQAFECPDLPDDDILASLINRPIVPFDPSTIKAETKTKKVKTEKAEEKKIDPIVPEIVEDSRPIKLPYEIGVYVCLSDKQGLVVKKRIPLTLEDLRPWLTAWLNATDQYHQGQLKLFKDSLINCPHNALVLYLYRPYTWEILDVAGDKQLRRKETISASAPELRPPKKGTIIQPKRDAIPELGSMYQISPIKIEENGNTYLAQTYIERTVDGEYLLQSRKIAVFEKGVLRYHQDLFEPERDKHDIRPLVYADGIKIFPQMSIFQIQLQTLEPDPIDNTLYITVKRPFYEKIDGQLVLKSDIKSEEDKARLLKVNNDYVIHNQSLNPAINFPGFKHPNITTKDPKKHKKTERQNVKPVKLHNEKVGINQVEFWDIIGTVPMLLRLTPSETGYRLVGLPVKIPDELTYDVARYIVSNLGRNAVPYFNNEIKRIQSLSQSYIGGYTRQQMIDMLDTLCNSLIKDDKKKLDPSHVLDSKNKLKVYMSKQTFYSSPTDPYYCFYPLASVKIVQETESQKYSYRLTNFGDTRALARNNLSSLVTWIQRISYNLKNYYGIKKPTFEEVKSYLEDHFRFKTCQLKVYYDNGIFFEIEHLGQTVAKQLITIVDPANAQKSYNLSAVKIGRNIQFGDNRIFEKVLCCNQSLHSDIIQFAKAQLSKTVDKFISANEKKLVGKDAIVQTTKIHKLVGFADSTQGFSQIKKTFLKFITPFCESLVDRGKIFNLRTGNILDKHSANELFEKMTENWKEWDRDKKQTIMLGNIEVKKPNPGKMMIEVHNKVYNYPHLDEIVWSEVLEVWFQLTSEPIGFRTATGVVLTPWTIQDNPVDIWKYRIKVQYIDILRGLKSSKSEASAIQSHLQLSRHKLREILDTVYPNWEKNVSKDVLKHLDALENALMLAKQAAKL